MTAIMIKHPTIRQSSRPRTAHPSSMTAIMIKHPDLANTTHNLKQLIRIAHPTSTQSSSLIVEPRRETWNGIKRRRESPRDQNQNYSSSDLPPRAQKTKPTKVQHPQMKTWQDLQQTKFDLAIAINNLQPLIWIAHPNMKTPTNKPLRSYKNDTTSQPQ